MSTEEKDLIVIHSKKSNWKSPCVVIFGIQPHGVQLELPMHGHMRNPNIVTGLEMVLKQTLGTGVFSAFLTDPCPHCRKNLITYAHELGYVGRKVMWDGVGRFD